jgi:diaminopimelate decarboxylase
MVRGLWEITEKQNHMKAGSEKSHLIPEDWGFSIDRAGELTIGNCSCVNLAGIYGTPLHVVDESRLTLTAENFLSSFTKVYPGQLSAHYAFKCNPVPGVINVIKKTGFKAEVMSEFELNLALKLGFYGKDIIVNGPFKPENLLSSCIENNVHLVIVDSLQELQRLNLIAGRLNKKANILLRINPDYTPKGMNKGSATGSRKGCSLGFDLKSGEPVKILGELTGLDHLQFNGYHFHIGTGIRRPDDYRKALELLKDVVAETFNRGFEVRIMDIGGGFAASGTWEMTTREMLFYQAIDHLPSIKKKQYKIGFKDFAKEVTQGISMIFPEGYWPELITEPGRCIASSSQVLLLGVHQVKERAGLKQWLTADGGIGTVTMPTFYEYHEVFLCNNVHRPNSQYVNINGPGCFASDMVYRNKYMPEVKPGEVLAIMDSGAYFTSWESNFGYPRPAVIEVAGGKHRLIRRRETFRDMMERDEFND